MANLASVWGTPALQLVPVHVHIHVAIHSLTLKLFLSPFTAKFSPPARSPSNYQPHPPPNHLARQNHLQAPPPHPLAAINNMLPADLALPCHH